MRAARMAATDRQLFLGAIGGGKTSFRRLVSRHALLVQSEICARLPRHVSHAKYLTVAVFKEAHRHLPRLKDPARFRQWVMALAERVCDTVEHRCDRARKHVGISAAFVKRLDRLHDVVSLLGDRIVMTACRLRGRSVPAVVARFGRISKARKMNTVPDAAGPLAGVGKKLASLPLSSRRVLYYHLIAGLALEEISSVLGISFRKASVSLLRGFIALGMIPWEPRVSSFAYVRRAAMLPSTALQENPEAGKMAVETFRLQNEDERTLRFMKTSILRHRIEAQALRMTTREHEKLSLRLPRMIRSPRSGYKWNLKVRVKRPKLLPVSISAIAHAAALVVAAVMIMGLARTRRLPPSLEVEFRPVNREEESVKPEEFIFAPFPDDIRQRMEKELPPNMEAELSEEESIMEMLLETLRESPSTPREEIIAAARELRNSEEDPDSREAMDELIERLQKPVSYNEKPDTAQPWRPSSRSSAGGQARDGAHGDDSAGPVDKAEEERLERAREWRRRAHEKLKERLARVRITTDCFTVLQDKAYDKKSAFSSLAEARAYVQAEFLDEMFKSVARRCKADKNRIRNMWESRKTMHPKTVRLGILGTRMIENRTSVWSETDPIVRKRIIEYLIAETHCNVTRVSKEPCTCCGGKGYKTQMYMDPGSGSMGFGMRKVPCPLCKGLGYELVIVYE